MHFVLTVLGEISELAACNDCNGPNEGRQLAPSGGAVSSTQISLWNEPNILELTRSNRHLLRDKLEHTTTYLRKENHINV